MLSLVFFLENGFIVVSPPDGQIPFVGHNVTFLCLVPDSSIYTNPVWLKPNGEEIPLFAGGRSKVKACKYNEYAFTFDIYSFLCSDC